MPEGDDSATGQPAVLITFGYSKDHRPDLKQVVVGTAVSGDGGVPLISKTHDGNTSDSVLPISYWERLRKLAGKSPFCFIGDCKIASKETLGELCSQQGGLFLAPMAMTTAEQAVLVKKMKEGKLNFLPVEELKAEEGLKPIYERLTNRVGNRHKKKEKTEQGADSYKVYEVEKLESVRKKIGRGRPGPDSQYVTEENLRYDLAVYRHQKAIEDDALLDGIFLMVSNHDLQL